MANKMDPKPAPPDRATLVLALAAQADALTNEAENLLCDLVNFRTGGKLLTAEEFLKAVQDIRLLKDVLV